MIWHNLDDSQRKKYAYIIIEAGNILFLDYFEDRRVSQPFAGVNYREI